MSVNVKHKNTTLFEQFQNQIETLGGKLYTPNTHMIYYDETICRIFGIATRFVPPPFSFYFLIHHFCGTFS